ncbi:MAG: photosynthetic reaction center subunit H [Phyllobacteriaceae bacterium]|jgi:photosynthetic reaction center H subunit|nr:photosynthetic reaction center subunit H [Phyllobacteriaceae bacterium]
MVEITGYIDVAQVTLYVFWVFFAGLIFYLQRESRREGFPLEDDAGNKDGASWLFTPAPKAFHLAHGHGVVLAPSDKGDANADPANLKGAQVGQFSGAPWQPDNEMPMLDGIGPGSWTARANVPDMLHNGAPKIVPMREDATITIAEGDMDPRGLRVVGCDSIVAGRVSDVWVDRMEHMIRFLEIETEVGDAPRRVLVPMNFVVVKTPRDREKVFYVHAITGEQFAMVPGTQKVSEVTLLEEEKIMAYFGAGLLYATPERQEAYL